MSPANSFASIPTTPIAPRYDVVIIGGGLAGLTLARQLLLETKKSVLLLEQQDVLPARRQKVGESSVQLAGHYLGKVLDLEEHLLLDHFMKYNLRFFWRAESRAGGGYEDYGQSYIRPFSNVPSYQIDRNVLEAELVRCNLASPRFSLVLAARRLDVRLAEDDGNHGLGFERGEQRFDVEARWVVDASGRNRVLAKRLGLRRPSEIRHGASFLWVEGQIDLEKLTSRSRREIRIDPARRHLGHLPAWLATNHFCGEGFWFWVIPLRGKTSLGLVYDHDSIDPSSVSSQEKLRLWIKQRFPIFEQLLDNRRIVDWWGYRSFAHDAARTIHPARWAMTGEAGRFTDPLYSPGSDLIGIYNTLIVDAIETTDQAELEAKTRRAEAIMRAVYEAYVPSYALSYQTLGDQEAFSLKYIWELTIYFGFYVFPFINDLLTERRFVIAYLRAFARLGPLNHQMQRLLVDFYRWKKAEGCVGTSEPRHFDFLSLGPLAKAEKAFYEVGITIEAAKKVIHEQLVNVEELARFIAAYVASRVVGAPAALTNAAFVEQVARLADLRFDVEGWHAALRASEAEVGKGRQHVWSFDHRVLDVFARPAQHAEAVA